MIIVTRLNKQPFYLNSDLIELIEEMPDTIITMTNGKRILVEESAATIVDRVIRFRNLCTHSVKADLPRTTEEKEELKKSLVELAEFESNRDKARHHSDGDES
jgi:flagellar protein FlbD